MPHLLVFHLNTSLADHEVMTLVTAFSALWVHTNMVAIVHNAFCETINCRKYLQHLRAEYITVFLKRAYMLSLIKRNKYLLRLQNKNI